MKKSKISNSALNSSFTDSGKKLVQARLPFKLIASPVLATEESKNDSKKRKLPFADNDNPTKKICTSDIKENVSHSRDISPVLISDDDASSSDVLQPSSQEPALNPVVKLIKIDYMLENLEKLENAKNSPKPAKTQKGIIIKLPLTAKNKRKFSKSVEDKASEGSDVELVSDEICEKRKVTEAKNISEQSTDGQNRKSNSLMNYVHKVNKNEVSKNVNLVDKEVSAPKNNGSSTNDNISPESDVILDENSTGGRVSASQESNSKKDVEESSKLDDNNFDEGLNMSIAKHSEHNVSDLKMKALTPGQLKKAKDAEIKRLERQKLKEEKQKEKDEKERQRKKEKEEKEEQRKKDKEEKEKKKLAEIEAKNEEKRKKEEQKEEEKKKKEDEKKKREQEKEEAINKNKKAAEAFTKFFVQSTKTLQKEVYEDQNSNASDKFINTKFMPFQVKGHMKLAPLYRRTLNKSSKDELDKILEDSENAAPLDRLYLGSLKRGKISPGRDSRTWLKDDSSSDIMIVEDELEGAGQTIDDVNKPPAQIFRAKFLSFHENQRPPYHGTWRKKSNFVKPRKPFATDKVYFDYEIDSDDEWEEEEPGESLHGSDDEKESEDEYEVDNDFFVPHGHLSDEELQNEDETEDNSPEAQKAKLKILQQEFAQEMNKKTEKIKPRLVGIIWQDENGNQPDTCPSVLWKSLNKRAMIFANPIVITEPEQPEEAGSPTVEKKQIKRPQLSNALISDLINLVHGNRHKKEFIIKEFLAFLTKNSSDTEFTRPIIKEKFDKIATWKVLHVDIKNKKKKKCCWVVYEDILKEHGLEELTVFNKWQYTLQPKQFLGEISEDLAKPEEELCANNESKTKSQKKDPQSVKQIPAITKFTTVISKTNLEQLKPASTNKKSKVTEISEKKESIKSQSALAAKKRVPLLMSVPRGTAIPQSSKNALISKFLKKDTKAAASKTSPTASEDDVAMEVDSITID